MNLAFRATRIAPTPSGFLHEGNAYAFVLTAALAKIYGAELLLRIDDLDNDRKRPEYVADVFDTLQWLGIAWNQGPKNSAELDREWTQHNRLYLYEAALQALRKQGLLYACGCSRSDLARLKSPMDAEHTCRLGRLSLDKKDVAWRIRVPSQIELSYNEFGRGGTQLTERDIPHDPVVRRRDGIPAYHIASVCDDHHFGIDLIVRGKDLRSSTAVQLWLADQLGFAGFRTATFYHHPLLLGPNGEKWSKSAGAEAIKQFSEKKEASTALYRKLASFHGLGAEVNDLSTFAQHLAQKLG